MHCHLKAAQQHAVVLGCFWKNVYYAYAETAISKLPIKLLTLLLDSATPISYMVQIFWRSADIYHDR